MGRVRVCISLFIVSDGVKVGGRGLVEALEAIEKEGSIRGAARRLGINYRRLWLRVTNAEKLLGIKLVETSASGSKLTEAGKRIVETFRLLEEKFGGFCVDVDVG